MPADAAVVLQYDEIPCCDDIPVDAGPLPDVELPDDIAAQLDTVLPGATSAPLIVATYDPPTINWSTYNGPYPDRQGPIVATPAMIDIIGLDAADLATLRAEGSLWPLDPFGGNQEMDLTDTGELVAAGTSYPTEGEPIVLNPPLGEHVPGYGFSLYRPIVTPEYAELVGFDLVQRGVHHPHRDAAHRRPTRGAQQCVALERPVGERHVHRAR